MTNSECWVINCDWCCGHFLRLCLVCWGFLQTMPPLNRLWKFILCQRPYKWIERCYWLSHTRVVINICEPSCEKNKCAVACFSTVCASSFLSLVISTSLAASIWMPPLTHIITLRHGLRKFQQDAGLIPRLTVLTVCHLLCSLRSLTARYASPPGHSGIGSPQKKNTR